MMKHTLNVLLIVFLMLPYINRGLLVNMSGDDFAYLKHASQTKGEINSVLELVLYLTGYDENDIDEDGDSPDDFTSFQFSQLLVCHDFAYINNPFFKDIRQTFYIFNDINYSQSFYGQIDHPPEN